MTRQLELLLVERKTPARERPVIDRLLALVQRSGVDTDRKASKGRVMFRPELEKPHGAYIDLCSGWDCLNRMNTLYTYGYGNKAEQKRLDARSGQ